MARERSLLHDLSEAGERPEWQWDKLDAQRNFLVSDARFTCYSGGFATGKTTALCNKIILLLLIPNNFGYLGRLDGKALRASTIEVLLELLPKEYIAKHNDQRGFLRLRPEFGGGKLAYGDFKDLNDLKNIPLGFFGIDQLEEVSEDVWNYLVGRLRRKNPILQQGLKQYWVVGSCPQNNGGRHFAIQGEEHCYLCYAPLPPFNEGAQDSASLPPWELLCYNTYGLAVCNPEGPSHWIYKNFPGLPSDKGISGPGQPGYQAFTATIWDALRAGFVTSTYVKDLEERYRERPLMWTRYLEGKWIEAEGLVYPGWDAGQQVIHRHQTRYDELPLLEPGLELYEAIDHGLTAPTAVGWFAVRPCDCGCGRLDYYLIDEHYEGGKAVSYHAACIKQHRERLSHPIAATYLDSQAFSRTLMGQTGTPRADSLYSVADEYGDHGIYPVPTQKDWDAGYNRISEILLKDPDHRHPITGQLGAPHLYVFSHCTNFIHEIETYKWKKARPGSASKINEEPQDADDHLMDLLNGFLTSRPGEVVKWERGDDSLLLDLDLLDMRETGHMAL